ncbi:hypothetical protein D3C86_1496120 [compost metagenome]
MAGQLADDVLHHAGEGGAVQAGGAGEVVAAAGLLLRLVAVLQSGQHQGADALGDPLADCGGQQHVDVHAHVVAVLFQGADRQHQYAVALGDLRFVFLPGQFANENALAHCCSPWSGQARDRARVLCSQGSAGPGESPAAWLRTR